MSKWIRIIGRYDHWAESFIPPIFRPVQGFFTSSFSHVAFLHVFFNLSSLHNLRALEAGYGPLKFLDVVGALALGGGLAAPLVSRLQVRSTDTICMFLLATCFARRFAHPFACCFTRS